VLRASLFIATLGVASFGVAATQPDSLGGSRELRVCADPNNLPFSNRAGEGFENRIADLVGRAMNRRVVYTWWPQRRGFMRQTLRAGVCDVVMAIPASSTVAQPTRAYYRSTYVFVSRHDRRLALSSLDDPRLRQLRIGIQLTGNDYDNPPPAQALASRRLTDNVRGFMVYGDYATPAPPLRDVIDAVVDGRVDTSIVWGPVAGYFARAAPVRLDVTPVSAPSDRARNRARNRDRDGAGVPFTFAIAMGVRRGDETLRNALNEAITAHANEIRQILRDYGVPLQRM
jgi:mxaJ protein